MVLRTWTCPACSRRVPENVALCRCGTSRTEAQAGEALREVASGPAVRRRNEPLPTEIKVWLAVIGLALVGSIVFAVRADPPAPVAPLLGWTDPPLPSPSPFTPSRTRR